MAKKKNSLSDIIAKEFSDMVDLSKVDTKIKHYYDTGVYSLNYIMSKNLFGGVPSGRVTAFDGKSGTGKSLLSARVMADPKADLIILIDVEGGGHGRELIDFAGVDPSKVRRITANTFASYRYDKGNGKLEEVKDSDLPSGNMETDKYVYTEGITSKIRRLIHTITINKISSNIIIVLDSLANIQSVRALSGTSDTGKRAQDVNQFFRNFDIEFEKTNISFIFTNKLYQAVDGSGRMIASGGEAPVYNPSITVRFLDAYETDDMTSKEIKEQNDSKRTAIGRTIKPIRAQVIKSRFGTEQRNITFLIDMGYGPVKLSGLFGLCRDFGVIQRQGGAWYSMPGIIDKKFYKKDFISLVREDEENIMKKIQEKLEEVEKELKQSRQEFQANDINEINQDKVLPEVLSEEEEEMIKDEEFSEMKKIMEKEK